MFVCLRQNHDTHSFRLFFLLQSFINVFQPYASCKSLFCYTVTCVSCFLRCISQLTRRSPTIQVTRQLTRYKHWFQYRNATKYKHDTLVVAQFRNPYDWLEAMRNVPHHSPNHMFMHWSEFLTKPWTMDRIGMDLNISKDYRCQEDFHYDELNSCVYEPLPHEAYRHKLRYSEHQPFYELKQDGSGEPFANIMEMRAAKIRNFLDTKDYVGVADVWPVQYEYLLSKGTKGMLDKISEWTGVPYKCDPFPVQHRRKRKLSKRFAKYVNEHHDWTAEGLIGYTQEKPDVLENPPE